MYFSHICSEKFTMSFSLFIFFHDKNTLLYSKGYKKFTKTDHMAGCTTQAESIKTWFFLDCQERKFGIERK
jgi:hypothetical protein